MIVSVAVGWTTTRPIIPDEHVSFICLAVEPDDPTDPASVARAELGATLTAAQWVMGRRGAQMPTSTRILDIEL